MPGWEVYEFEEFTLDVAERRLSRAGQCISLAPKPYDLLLALVRRAGQLVGKRELLDLVWPDSFVEEGILAVHISALRKAVGGGPGQPRFIETVSRSGYRFVAAVRQLGADEIAASRKQWSVAVLPARPFTTQILPGQDQSAGFAIADALIDRLGRCHELIVRPARAVHAYLNGADDPAAIGRALRVYAVIDSHYFGAGDRIRMSVRLIRSEDGARLWNADLDEPATGILEVAGMVAECVAARLGSKFRESHPPRIPPRRPARPEAYALLGRGRFHLLSASMFEIPKAVEAFRAAAGQDPAYAPAHAGLALAHCAEAAFRLAPPAEAYHQARAAALRALAMDDACADAQVALGAVMFFGEWNWTGAERSLQRALQLNPNHSEGYLVYGQLLDALGRLDEGLEMKLRALERDPFSPLVHLEIALSYWNQRRYDDAIEWANRTLELDPRHPHAREYLAGAYLKKGDFARHLAENLKHAELHGAPSEMLENLKRTCAAEGRAGIVRLVLERAAERPGAFPAMQLALFHGEAGDLDAAFRHLEQAIESRDPSLVHLAVAPQWDALRADPRFNECLARMGLSASRSTDLTPG